MSVSVSPATKQELSRLISSGEYIKLSDKEIETFNRCLMVSSDYWIGSYNNKPVCIWGLIPPTILSDVAYLWLHTTNDISIHQFLLIRYSQRVMEKILKIYPRIIGHCLASNDRAVRWLRWLGATFDPPDGLYLPFEIKAKEKSVG